MNKKIFYFFGLLFLSYFSQAQWTNKNFQFDGLNRQYRIYVSPNYQAAHPASVVLTLHGLGDNMTNFSQLGFQYIADTANIIVVVPQAILDPNTSYTAWHSGAAWMGYVPNSGINDVGFLNALLDTVISNYSVNLSRIYICGMSMGGFMTQRMALQSNTRFAAFGSMSGTIGSGLTPGNPGRYIPMIHFHGTADATVAYTGNAYGIDVDSLVNFWVANNQCNPVPDSTRYPDVAADNFTVDCFKYHGTGNQQDFWLVRLNNVGHTILYQPANDITEVMEMWLFFRTHSLPNASVNAKGNESEVMVYPNPASDRIYIDLGHNKGCNDVRVEIFTMEGKLLYASDFKNQLDKISIDTHGMGNGTYVIRINSGNTVIHENFVVLR